MGKNGDYKWSFREGAGAFLKAWGRDLGRDGIKRRSLTRHFNVRQKIFTGEGGEEVSYLVAGNEEATPVFLIHGTPGSATGWHAYLEEPGGFRIIAVDRPGYGPVRQAERVDIDNDIKLLSGIIKKESKENKAFIVGHSMGGGMATGLALACPDNVKALVLMGAAVDPAQEKIWPVQRAFKSPWLSWVLGPSNRRSNNELFAYGRFLERLQPRLDELKLPVVAVHARDDGLVPYANVDFMREQFRNVASFEVVELAKGRHAIPHTRPEILKDILQRYDI